MYLEEILEDQNSLIEEVFEREKSLMTFHFNKLNNIFLLDQQIKINKAETLNDLKEKIAKVYIYKSLKILIIGSRS